MMQKLRLNYTRLHEHTHLKFMSMSDGCVRTSIYIEDIRTKKVNECAVTSERIVCFFKPRIVMSCPRCVDSVGIRILWLRSSLLVAFEASK